MKTGKSVLLFKSRTQVAFEQIALAMDDYVQQGRLLIEKAKTEEDKVAVANAVAAIFHEKFKIDLKGRRIGTGPNARELYDSVSSDYHILNLREQFVLNRNAIYIQSNGGFSFKLRIIKEEENGKVTILSSK